MSAGGHPPFACCRPMIRSERSTARDWLSIGTSFERAARRLSIDHRAVVVLHYYLDLPLAEISTLLGVPLGTVRSRLRYAMHGMRAALEADARPNPKEAAR